KGKLDTQNAPDGLIQISLWNLPGPHQVSKVVVIEAADHVHVGAGQKCFSRGGDSVVSNAMGYQFPHRAIIGHYDSAKSPLFPQDLSERKWIGSGRNPIDGVERAHNAGCACIDRGVKRRQIELPQRVLRNLGAVVVSSAFGSAVAYIVFGTGSNAVRCIQPGTLVAANVGSGDSGSEIGVFPGALGNPAPARIAWDVDHGGEGPTDSAGRSLAGRDSGGLLNQLRIPRGGEGQRNGKFRPKAVDHVEPKQNWYMEP